MSISTHEIGEVIVVLVITGRQLSTIFSSEKLKRPW
jgi:hypothetical protein